MSTATTIARRELASYFRQPAGWIIVALFLFLSGLVFSLFILAPGRPASMRDFFSVSGWLLLPVVPAISMRLLSEEFRSGTVESLLTAPVGSVSLVLGKYLGGAAFLFFMILPTPLLLIVLARFATTGLDYGPVLSGYACLALLGLLYLAIGTLASALTSNATLAFMMTLFCVLALIFAGAASSYVPEVVRPALASLAIGVRTVDFAKGVLDTSHVVFFVTLSAWCLAMAVGVMEVRRWR